MQSSGADRARDRKMPQEKALASGIWQWKF